MSKDIKNDKDLKINMVIDNLVKKANIAIIDLNEEYTITRDNIYSKAKNTPFLDTKCFGLVKYHILDGKIEKL